MASSSSPSPVESDDSDAEISERLIGPHHNARRSSESPLRKRPRYDRHDMPVRHDSESADLCPTAVSERRHSTSRSLVRDETYYLADGSCVLLVEETLFNVHRTTLSKDSSSFSAMFSLPQGTLRPEGLSDTTPIKLRGDTASEFRNLLWALYALPHELAIVHTPEAPLARLIDIAKLSNKYSFKSVELWSLDAIQEYVNLKPSPILLPNPLSYTFSPPTSTSSTSTSVDQLSSLIRLAQLCSHETLLTTTITLLRQLMSESIQYAYLAMTLADELDLKGLRGAAYAEVLQKAMIVKDFPIFGAVVSSAAGASSSSLALALPPLLAMAPPGATNPNPTGADTVPPPVLEPEPPLTSAQRLRLLTGYYRLTRMWDHLRLHPLTFEHANNCRMNFGHGCMQTWNEWWKGKVRSDEVLSLPRSDVLGRLKAVVRGFDRWGSSPSYMPQDCRLNARREIMERIKAIEDGLGDIFLEG